MLFKKMYTSEDVLYCFHHIHHINDENHKVHHCGGKHVKVDQKVNYEIEHCSCKKHCINKEVAIGHTTNEDLEIIELKFKFTEKCPYGGWHIESGKIVK